MDIERVFHQNLTSFLHSKKKIHKHTKTNSKYSITFRTRAAKNVSPTKYLGILKAVPRYLPKQGSNNTSVTKGHRYLPFLLYATTPSSTSI